MQQTFEEKVRAMSAKEIIMAMVEGLKNPFVKVDMDTFGKIDDGICYGCAATNAICKISGVKFVDDKIKSPSTRSRAVNSKRSFLYDFESAIDALRRGDLDDYCDYARGMDIAQIINPKKIELPFLGTHYTQKKLDIYVQLANDQVN